MTTPPSNSPAMTTTSGTAAVTGSTLTIASMPASLMLGVGCDSRKPDLTGIASISAANTPLAQPHVKHCTFALTPVIIPPPNNKVSFLTKTRFHANLRSPSVPISVSPNAAAVAAVAAATALATTTTTTCSSAPSLVEQQDDAALTMRVYRALEQRQSLQSQITTIDDIDTDLDGLGLDAA